ncbi:MAG: SOS response-associated peptidase family protein [Verrucomicrobiales bacterium]|nr:SOS response-associated peptidase family protein [Verrucomicrobiales bacterium]
MCNLYDIGPARHRNRLDWEEVVLESLRKLEKPFGIRKTDPGLVIRSFDAAPAPEVMRWGFERDYNPAVNNARSEKLNGVWSGPWESKRRCLIPVSTFYEWSGSAGNKQTHAFQPRDNRAFLWMAGLWEDRENGPAFTTLTRAATGIIAEIHDRMPVILREDQFEAFLNEPDPRGLLLEGVTELETFHCHNPLLKSANHAGAEPRATDMLPGFE